MLTEAALISGPTPNSKSFLSSPSYAITIATGVEMVAAPSSATPVPYGSDGECDNDGAGATTTSTSSTTTTSTTTITTVPAATTTTTTTVPPTTKTVARTTTTVTASNNVAVRSSSLNFFYYGDQELLNFSNQAAITSMTITINVVQTSGLTYNSFPGGAVTDGHSMSGGFVHLTYTLNGGQTIRSNYPAGQVGAQWSANGSIRVTSGDTWSVTSTSGGITSALSGTFQAPNLAPTEG